MLQLYSPRAIDNLDDLVHSRVRFQVQVHDPFLGSTLWALRRWPRGGPMSGQRRSIANSDG